MSVLRPPDAEGTMPAGTDMWIAILSVGDIVDAAQYPLLVGAVPNSPITQIVVEYLKHLEEQGTILAQDREAIIEGEDSYWIELHGPYHPAAADAYTMTPDEAAALVQQIEERQGADPEWSVELDQVLAGRRRRPPKKTSAAENPRRRELKRSLMR